jgi:hypothetical protein
MGVGQDGSCNSDISAKSQERGKNEQVESRNGNECAKGGVNQGVALSEQMGRWGCLSQEVPLPAILSMCMKLRDRLKQQNR